jgi:glycosyltransferase involved in cell wall biosynthesis
MKIAIRQVRGNSGTDVWADSLCTGLQQEGHECTVDLRSPLYQFVRAPAQENPESSDIIHGNSWNGFAFKEDRPLVVTEHLVVHDPSFDPYKSLLQKIYHRWIYRCEQKSLLVSDAVTCVSKYAKKQLELGFDHSDASVIYNGIDTSIFQPGSSSIFHENIPQERCILFYAGNLSKRKGSDLLPRIMKELGDQFLLVIASGYSGNEMTDSKNIKNFGHLSLPQLVKMFNRCDIFLTPTRLEGFGLSVAEAMSCAKPIVATNGSSLPELVIDGKGGFLCEMDNVNEFADRIRYLAEEPDEREKMGRFNRGRVTELFSQDMMVKKYLTLYNSLV